VSFPSGNPGGQKSGLIGWNRAGAGVAVDRHVALITTPESEAIIGCAMRVHTDLGPGLLEKAYAKCLAVEFSAAGLRFQQMVPLTLDRAGLHVPGVYVADFIVEDSVLVELKCVDRLLPIHSAQVVTYLRLAKLQKGLIFNFKVTRLKDGIKSVILPQ
jgi:GxxExxY protein